MLFILAVSKPKEPVQTTLYTCVTPLYNTEVECELFITQSQLLTTLYKKPFQNIVGKRENAGDQRFLLFPQCFLPFPKQISTFDSHLNCSLQMLSIWIGLKFCRLVES